MPKTVFSAKDYWVLALGLVALAIAVLIGSLLPPLG
jgi:hypothetical protein